jgi:transketolase
MPANNNKDKKKAEHHYWRVIVTYSDGETSGNRVFKDRAKAETFAARQKKAHAVTKTLIEPFATRKLYRDVLTDFEIAHTNLPGNCADSTTLRMVRYLHIFKLRKY